MEILTNQMDLDQHKFLSTQLGVKSIPTFLYYHKRQQVKMQSGADSNAIISNLNWMVSTYKLVDAPVAQQAKPNQLPGFKIYKE